MRHLSLRITFVAALLGTTLLSACATSGLSPRSHSLDYADFIYQSAETRQTGSEIPALRLPTTLAVAQIGENAPPAVLIQQLQQRPDLFSEVVAIPLPVDRTIDYGRIDATMRRVAASAGAQQVLVVGGDLDSWAEPSFLSVLDLLIVPAFVVPSRKLTMDATAAGALFDVDSGALRAMISANAEGSRYAASAHVDDARARLAHDQRRVLGGRIAERLIERLADPAIAETRR